MQKDDKMNALNLADELDVASSEMEYNHIVNDWKLLSDSATMLRQQHAEIEALRKQLELTSHNLKMGVSKSIQKVIANAIDEVLRGE